MQSNILNLQNHYDHHPKQNISFDGKNGYKMVLQSQKKKQKGNIQKNIHQKKKGREPSTPFFLSQMTKEKKTLILSFSNSLITLDPLPFPVPLSSLLKTKRKQLPSKTNSPCLFFFSLFKLLKQQKNKPFPLFLFVCFSFLLSVFSFYRPAPFF